MKNISSLEKVSVIVPVYNAGLYVEDCIDSILNQTYKNIEVIIINDGSTDNSGKIIDEYLKNDKRLIVKHQENQGVSHARNSALDIATGDWVMFVDADDILPNNSIKTMLYAAINSNSDFVSGVYKPFLKEIKYNLIESNNNFGDYRICDNKNTVSSLLYQRSIANAPFSKLFKTKSIGDIRFNESISVSEDLLFNYTVIKNINQAALINDIVYLYRNNPNSAINKPFSAKRMTGLSATNLILSDARQKDFSLLPAINRHFMEALFILSQLSQKKSYSPSYDRCIEVIQGNKSLVAADANSPMSYRIFGLLSIINPMIAVNLYKIKIRAGAIYKRLFI